MKIELNVVYELARIEIRPRHIDGLVNISRELRRLHARYSNGRGWSGGWDQSDQAWYDQSCQRLVDSTDEILRTYPDQWFVYFQPDPRGPAIYLIDRNRLKGRPLTSCYAQIGIAVY